MRNKKLLALVALLVVAGFISAGCETMAGSAGTGAGLGAITGGIIGHQQGRGWEGAALGAAVGGMTGMIVHDIRAQRTQSPEAVQEEYIERGEWEPESQNRILEMRRAAVEPRELRRGQTGRARMEYDVLGMRGTEIVETREIRRGNQVVGQLSSEAFTRGDGTWESSQPFDVTSDMDPGLYTMVQRVRGGGLDISRSTQFEVVR